MPTRVKTTSVQEKVLLITVRTHGSLVGKVSRGQERREDAALYEWRRCVSVYIHTGSLFSNGLIKGDTNLFLFRKYTNHLQVLSASAFAEWPYVKQRNECVWCFCVRASSEGRVLVRGAPLVKQGRSHLRTKWLQRQQRCWRPCLWAIMGSNQRQGAH